MKVIVLSCGMYTMMWLCSYLYTIIFLHGKRFLKKICRDRQYLQFDAKFGKNFTFDSYRY